MRRAVDGADLRRAHRRAAEAARLALFAVDHASLSITTVAEDGTIVYANDYACRVFAAERENVVGRKLWELDAGMSSAAWSREWERVAHEGAAEFRSDSLQPDGARFVLDVTANYLQGADLIISYGRDVTARVAAEARPGERGPVPAYRRDRQRGHLGL